VSGSASGRFDEGSTLEALGDPTRVRLFSIVAARDSNPQPLLGVPSPRSTTGPSGSCSCGEPATSEIVEISRVCGLAVESGTDARRGATAPAQAHSKRGMRVARGSCVAHPWHELVRNSGHEIDGEVCDAAVDGGNVAAVVALAFPDDQDDVIEAVGVDDAVHRRERLAGCLSAL
jgi:hypothetical protein